jgi:diamine N-acetyltransferase
MSKIALRPLDKENWLACAQLELPEAQKGFVASNVYSIAESKFELHYCPRAICLNDTIVGFLMYCEDDEPDDEQRAFCIFRMMIAAPYQGQGIGREAIRLAMAEIRAAGGEVVRTMYKPTNEVAGRLYRQLGFHADGLLDDGDVKLSMDLR